MKLSVPVALLDTWTGDGRMLRSPQSGTVRHLPFPLPVRGSGPDRAQVGTVDALDISDGVLMASVTVPDPEDADALLRGDEWLELDVDSVPASDLVVHGGSADRATRLEFIGWRVVALTVGTSPCWDLEPATEIREKP